jgi:hypothetical protein
MKNLSRCVVAACLVAGPLAVHAAPVKVQIDGVVDYNVIKGGLDGIPSGAPTSMSFMLDSTDYVDSGSFPTRGYTIDLSSFSMTVGGVAISMDIPQPGGVDAYFVLRDNDPAIDGFFISLGSVDWPFPLSVHIPDLAPAHDLDFSYTFADGDTLSSLDILDAVGTYGPPNVSAYLWALGRFGNNGAEFSPETITISAVPEPSSVALMALGGLMVGFMVRRRANRA